MRYISVLSVICLLISCKESGYNKKPQELVQQYCFSCHKSFNFDILPKDIWAKHVLPRMGARLGIYESGLSRATLIENDLVQEAQIYPEAALISQSDWTTIKEYILSLAPTQIDQPIIQETLNNSLFTVEKPSYIFSPPSTIYSKIGLDGTILISDINTKSLNFIHNGKIDKSAQLPSPVVDLIETPTSFITLCIGDFSPTDAPSGSIIGLPKNGGRLQVLADSLHRPVHFSMADADNDGDLDLVISEFGKWLGGVTLLRNNGGKLYKESISTQSGATKSYFSDINNDGLIDIVVLYAQGSESITAYIADNWGDYNSKDLITFHPAMGSSYMDLIDFDSDGDLDIIYTAGDNADYTPILKPYHGIYLYNNKGDLTFEQETFLPMHGAYKAIIEDFDQDNDLDIVAISFFPDFTQEKTSFIYFENSKGTYLRSKLIDHTIGRWIVMDKGDIDSDGDIDLILGSLSMEVLTNPELVESWINRGIGYLVLKNKIR